MDLEVLEKETDRHVKRLVQERNQLKLKIRKCAKLTAVRLEEHLLEPRYYNAWKDYKSMLRHTGVLIEKERRLQRLIYSLLADMRMLKEMANGN